MLVELFSKHLQWFTPDNIVQTYGDDISGRLLHVQNASMTAQWKVAISDQKKSTLKNYIEKYLSIPHSAEVGDYYSFTWFLLPFHLFIPFMTLS